MRNIVAGGNYAAVVAATPEYVKREGTPVHLFPIIAWEFVSLPKGGVTCRGWAIIDGRPVVPEGAANFLGYEALANLQSASVRAGWEERARIKRGESRLEVVRQ